MYLRLRKVLAPLTFVSKDNSLFFRIVELCYLNFYFFFCFIFIYSQNYTPMALYEENLFCTPTFLYTTNFFCTRIGTLSLYVTRSIYKTLFTFKDFFVFLQRTLMVHTKVSLYILVHTHKNFFSHIIYTHKIFPYTFYI